MYSYCLSKYGVNLNHFFAITCRGCCNCTEIVLPLDMTASLPFETIALAAPTPPPIAAPDHAPFPGMPLAMAPIAVPSKAPAPAPIAVFLTPYATLDPPVSPDA